MAGLTLPIIATDFGTIAKNEQAIGKLNTTIAKSTDTQAKAVERATQALDAYSRKADQVARKKRALVDATPDGQPVPKLGPIEESILKMDRMLKGLAASISEVFSKQEKEMTALAAAMTKDTVTREKQISAIRLGESAKYADVRATEKQEMALIKAEAALRAYNQATHKSTVEAELAKEAKEALIKAMASRQRAGIDARQRAYDLTLPGVQETEQLKVLNSATLQAITHTQRLTGEKLKQEEASKEINKQLAADIEIQKLIAKEYLATATAAQRRTNQIAEERRVIADLRDKKMQELEIDKLAAQGAMQDATATQRNINMIAEETRRLQASMDSKNLDLHYLREKARLRNELAAAEAKAAVRTDPDTRGAGQRLAVLREQARLENELAIAQAKKSGVLRPLVAQLEQYRKQTDAAGVSAKTFSLRVHLAAQGAAAMRSAMYGMGASFGIFTSATLLVASSVYAVVSAFRSATQSALDYEEALAALGAFSSRARHGSQQYADDLLELDAAVRQAALSSKYTTVETTEAMKQLALAGLTATETIGAVPSTLRLAAIGALDFGKAADIATNIMMGFRLQVKDLPRVVDVLSKAATESNTDVEQLGTAMSYAAPLAESFGVSLEYTTAAMEVLANSGIKASRAGTGMRRVFLSLFTPTEKVTNAVEKFGITLGQFGEIEGLSEIDGLAVDLGNAGKGAAQAQKMLEEFYVATAAGTRNLQLIRNAVGVYATPAMIQLVKSVGMAEKSIQSLHEGLQNVSGSAEDQSKKMLDNLKAVGSSIKAAGSVAAAQLYQELAESIRGLADSVLAFMRVMASSTSTVKAFYTAVEKSVVLIGKLIGILILAKTAMMAYHVAVWAAIKAWGAFTLVMAAAPRIVAGIVAIKAAVIGMSAAFSGIAAAGGILAVMQRLPVVLGALGAAAIGAAGGWALFAAKAFPVIAILGLVAAAAKYVYDEFLKVPDTIDAVRDAYASLSDDSNAAMERMKAGQKLDEITTDLRRMNEEAEELRKQIETSTDTSGIDALKNKYAGLSSEINEATKAQKLFLNVALAQSISGRQGELTSGARLIDTKRAELRQAEADRYANDGVNQARALRGEVKLLEDKAKVTADLLRLDQLQYSLQTEPDEKKRAQALVDLREQAKLLKDEYSDIAKVVNKANGPYNKDKVEVYLAGLREIVVVLSRIDAETTRVAEAAPPSLKLIAENETKSLDNYHKRLKLLHGTELDRARAAKEQASDRAREATEAYSRIYAARQAAEATLGRLSEGTDAYSIVHKRFSELHAESNGLRDAAAASLEELKKQEDAYNSELDSSAKAQDKLTKTAYDTHMATVQLTKDIEDLRKSMMDLTEQTLARGTQFFSDITAGAGIAAKAFRQVTLSGEEMSQSVVQSVEATQTMRSGGRAGQPVSGPYSALFNRYGAESGVDPRLLQLQVGAESSGNPNAVSPTGVRGLAQFTTRTGRQYGITDWFNPEQQVRAQAAYMRDLLRQRNGNVPEALSMYQSGSPVPRTAETSRYVSRITQQYQGGGGSPTQQYQGGGGSPTQQNSALVDESKRVTFLTADENELAEARKNAAAAARDEFSIGKHIEGLRKTELETQAALRNAYQEVHYWNGELAEGRVTEVSQREAMKAATDVYTATLQRNSQARENQLKWEEYGTRTGKLKELQVVRETEELDTLREKYGMATKAERDFTYAKLELDLAYQGNARNSKDYEMALSRELTKVAQAQGEYAAFFDSLRYDSEDFAKIGVQAFTDLRDAMAEAFAGGKWNFEKMLTGMRDAAAKFAADQVMQGLFAPKDAKTGAGGGLLTGLGSMLTTGIMSFFADGGTFSAALPHGIYTQPTLFPMTGSGMRAFASGTGLLGEAGPEAVLPLVRVSGGDLGVKAQTAAPVVNVVVNTRPGETAKVSQNGNTLTIDIIEQALASRIAKGGSALPNAVEGSYSGMRRQGR